MKLASGLLIVITLVSAFPVSASAPKVAATQGELSSDDAVKAEKFLNQLINTLSKHQNDCPKMAKAIHTHLDTEDAWLEKVTKSGKALPAAVKTRLQKRQSELISAVKKCKGHKEAQMAMARFSAPATYEDTQKETTKNPGFTQPQLKGKSSCGALTRDECMSYDETQKKCPLTCQQRVNEPDAPEENVQVQSAQSQGRHAKGKFGGLPWRPLPMSLLPPGWVCVPDDKACTRSDCPKTCGPVGEVN